MKSTKQLVRQLEIKKKQLAKIRDELRKLEQEIEEFTSISAECVDDLTACIERLSQYF